MLDLEAVTGSLQIRLLGQFRMTVDEQPVERTTTARLQSLLAYLLLHADAPQSRAQLAFTFWPDASEANARNNLRQLLHQLRRALPDADLYLKADATSVQWARRRPSASTSRSSSARSPRPSRRGRVGDAAGRLAALERAVALAGPLLPSCYDDWIGPERDRIARALQGRRAALVALLEDAARVRERHRPRAALAASTIRSTSGPTAG